VVWERIDLTRQIKNDGLGGPEDRPDYFYIRRVYGWNGKLFPRLVLTITQQEFDDSWQIHIPTKDYEKIDPDFLKKRRAHSQGEYELHNWVGKGFDLHTNIKPTAKEWWSTCRFIPPELLGEVMDLLREYQERAPQEVPKHARP
jgi:hypothetical protein